jgi:hypothetical protein
MHQSLAKLGDQNRQQILGYYDTLSEKLGESAAIDIIYEAFLKLQANTANASLKNLLSQTAQEIWKTLENRTITVKAKTALERYREALQKAKAQEGKELEVEIGGAPRLGLFETKEVLRDNGILERHRVYKAVASEQSGLALEIRF